MLKRRAILAIAASRARTGLTLVEMMIAIVVGGVVLALFAAVSLRQQRVFADLADESALSSQLREAAAILPIDLRAAAAPSGDIRDARDTSIEIRGTIASGVVCDTTAVGALILAPALAGALAHAAFLTAVEAGDTAWVYTANSSGGSADSSDAWQPYRVASVTGGGAGQCAGRGPQLSDSARTVGRVALGLAPALAGNTAVGLPLRVTRVLRYSLYRASDGAWYLGEKDWNTAAAKFNTIQPVAGPFLSAASGGLRLQYIDSLGITLQRPVADPRGIALIRVELRGETRSATRALGAAAAVGKRNDSALVAVSLHNRR